MLDSLNALKNKQLNWSEFFGKYLTKGIIGLKYKLGLGLHNTTPFLIEGLHKLGFGIEDKGTLLAKELHKPVRTKFTRRRVTVYNIDDIWSADLTNSFQSLSKENQGYKYMLNVIDLFSKYAYSFPLKTKSADEIIDAFDRIFKLSGRQPKKLWTDQGSEFTNNKFMSFLKKHNIELYHVYNEGKACVIERFNKTLGEMIQKYLTAKKTSKYVDILQSLLDKYNHKTHSTIKMSPYEASKLENHSKVLETFMSKLKLSKPKTPIFKVGDRVRLYAKKGTFDKGYKPNWTTEIFVITKVNKPRDSDPTYHINDLKGEDILGEIYEKELQKTSF